MADRRTLEQTLIDQGKPVPDFAPCPNPGCIRTRCRPFEIVDVSDISGIPSDMACTRCLVDDERLTRHADERAQLETLPPWETPEGQELKARRNRALDEWRWTVAADSPLTIENQNAHLAYLQAWHRMTVDAETPGGFIEPERPPLVYIDKPVNFVTNGS